jgi:hypothetical protein
MNTEGKTQIGEDTERRRHREGNVEIDGIWREGVRDKGVEKSWRDSWGSYKTRETKRIIQGDTEEDRERIGEG